MTESSPMEAGKHVSGCESREMRVGGAKKGFNGEESMFVYFIFLNNVCIASSENILKVVYKIK